MDPTTTLIHHVNKTASHRHHPGVLAISCHCIRILDEEGRDSTAVLSLNLAGLPTAVQHLKGTAWALADSMADLHLVDLGQRCSFRKLTAGVPLTVAHVLCCVPESEGNSGVYCQQHVHSLHARPPTLRRCIIFCHLLTARTAAVM